MDSGWRIADMLELLADSHELGVESTSQNLQRLFIVTGSIREGDLMKSIR